MVHRAGGMELFVHGARVGVAGMYAFCSGGEPEPAGGTFWAVWQITFHGLGILSVGR